MCCYTPYMAVQLGFTLWEETSYAEDVLKRSAEEDIWIQER